MKIINIILVLLLIISFPHIASAEWVDADGANQDNVLVFTATTSNNNVQLDIDSQGRPHIIFIEDGGGFPSTWYLCYLYWDGFGWVDADGIGQESYRIFGGSAFVSPYYSFELNSLGQPGIAWGTQGDGVTYYLYWNGSAWVDADGTGQESMQVFDNYGQTSFRFRSDNNPSISFNYSDGLGNYYMSYLYWNGSSWVDADGVGQGQRDFHTNTDGQYYVNLTNGPSNHPMIAWRETIGGATDVYYLFYNGSAWVDADGIGQGNINVSNTGKAEFISLDKNLSNNPTISWVDDTPGNMNIYYLFWNGSAWVDADGAGQEGINIYSSSLDNVSPSLKIDTSNNYPVICWTVNALTKYSIYYLYWNGSAWVDADGTGQESIDIYPLNISGLTSSRSLSLSPVSSYPAVAWADGGEFGTEDPYFLKWIIGGDNNRQNIILPQTGKNLVGFVNRALGI